VATLKEIAIVALCCVAALPSPAPPPQQVRSTIAFVSTRDNPGAVPPLVTSGEIYLMAGDGTDQRRLTNNDAADLFPSLSPDGSRIVFESSRRRTPDDPANVSDLFLMNSDGSDQTWLVRGSSATWSPDGTSIAFHASASGKGRPVLPFPGAATSDSDIFIAKVKDLLEGKATPRNLTNTADAIDDDPDWSPDGRLILFTSHATTDTTQNATTAEIYTLPVGGGTPTRLTNNKEEERAPAWSPDGRRILFCCRRGGKADFDLCVMNADGSGERRITENPIGDLTPTWSPDGQKIAFHRRMGAAGTAAFQIFLINPDGTGETQLTSTPGLNGFPNWGEVRVRR
jgi:TolB protein